MNAGGASSTMSDDMLLPRTPTKKVEGQLLSPEDVLRFHRDGFLLVRNVLDAAEVETLRRAIVENAERAKSLGHVLKGVAGETVPVGDILGQPGVGWLLSDRRVLEIARHLIGRDDLVYFGDSGVMVGGDGRGFHKDNTVRDTANHPDWQSPYTLLRMGFYLRDHATHSGGLKVRRTSHLHADVTSGAIVDVPTRPGDVVVWNLRTTHSGHAVRVRGLPFLRLQPRFEQRLPKWAYRPEDGTRVAAFMTLGTNDQHLRNYIAKHTDAGYAGNYLYKAWLRSDGSEAAVRRLAEAGVTLLKPVPEYGRDFGDREPVREGFITASSGRADVYAAEGMEAWIRQAGRVLRALRLSSGNG
jgi:hypothetical protein